jgi:hypothetical protein
LGARPGATVQRFNARKGKEVEHERIISGSLGFSAGWIENILTQHLYAEPRSGIDWLLTTVERSKLSADLTKSLSAPLLAALQALDERKPGAACAQLKTFSDLVLAQSDRALTAAQAANLRDAAARLRSQTGCP